MDKVDPRLVSALTEQLAARQLALSRGAVRVGWKLGMGGAERIGHGPVLGHLTSETQLESGGVFRADGRPLHADVELAVEIAADVPPDSDVAAAVGRRAVALELVDLTQGGDEPEAIVAANVFHCAYAFGAWVRSPPPENLVARLIVDGEVRAAASVEDVYRRLRAAVGILASVDEALKTGDRVITGSIVQEPVHPGAAVAAELGDLGSVAVQIR